MNYLILSIILCSLSFQARASELLDVNTALQKLRLEKTIGTLTLDQVSMYYDFLRELKYLTHMDEVSFEKIVELNQLLNAEIQRSVAEGKIILEHTIEVPYSIIKLTEAFDPLNSDEIVSLTFAQRLNF